MMESQRKRKRKLIDLKEEEWKMYAHHKFKFANCGPSHKVENVFTEGGDKNAITLSYFSRPGGSE